MQHSLVLLVLSTAVVVSSQTIYSNGFDSIDPILITRNNRNNLIRRGGSPRPNRSKDSNPSQQQQQQPHPPPPSPPPHPASLVASPFANVPDTNFQRTSREKGSSSSLSRQESGSGSGLKPPTSPWTRHQQANPSIVIPGSASRTQSMPMQDLKLNSPPPASSSLTAKGTPGTASGSGSGARPGSGSRTRPNPMKRIVSSHSYLDKHASHRDSFKEGPDFKLFAGQYSGLSDFDSPEAQKVVNDHVDALVRLNSDRAQALSRKGSDASVGSGGSGSPKAGAGSPRSGAGSP